MTQKTEKTSKSGKNESQAKKAAAKGTAIKSSSKTVSRPKTSISKTSRGSVLKKKPIVPKIKKSVHKESTSMEVKQKKISPKKNIIPSKIQTIPGLLSQTKSSAAALAHFEKGIELLFRKDFKKAHAEFISLCQSFPSETEIIARARSYIQICEREEAAKKKIDSTADQQYTLGVLEHNKGNYDEAIAYYLQSLKNNPDVDYIYYSIAASQAMKGDFPGLMENLKKAILLNEDSRIYARNDADFSAFEQREEFAELIGISSKHSHDL